MDFLQPELQFTGLEPAWVVHASTQERKAYWTGCTSSYIEMFNLQNSRALRSPSNGQDASSGSTTCFLPFGLQMW